MIIPKPNFYHEKSGKFIIKSPLKYNYSHELESGVKFFKDFMINYAKIDLEKEEYANFNFLLDFSLSEEQYKIIIKENTLDVYARCSKGAFYAIQSLKQIYNFQNQSFPCVEIDDEPRFSYRGFMIDVARHFFDKNVIMRLIDLISFHKFNTIHLHLTDDQGYRIESIKYPNLNKIGSIRKGTILKNKQIDNQIHQGYYTKQDIKEIVEYAKERFINVIPEIDMPGHMNALIASYPETLCTNEKIEVNHKFGINKNILCAGNDKVYKMLEDILLEIMDMFDSKFIHIGGDEVKKTNWKTCLKCQQKMKENNLKNVNELQTYFINHFTNFLREHNKEIICWNDCLNHHLSNRIIIQHWKPFSNKKTIHEINNGRKVIISNFFHLYLDYPYALTPLIKTYQFDPVLNGVNKESETNVIGIEAPLWTEWVKSLSKIEFQIFPRLAAVSEVAWTTPINKDYEDFIKRLKKLYRHYNSMNVFYAINIEKKPKLLKRLITTFKWFKSDEDIEYKEN